MRDAGSFRTCLPKPAFNIGLDSPLTSHEVSKEFKWVEARDVRTCGLTTDGEAQCWGGKHLWMEPVDRATLEAAMTSATVSSEHAGVRHSRGLLNEPWVPTRWVGADSCVWGLIRGCLALVFGRNQAV
jgi:hypothetical protein